MHEYAYFMPKEHDKWIPLKKKIDGFDNDALFHEQEIWWCFLGVNVGHEQDGKGDDFRRPVLIVRKFSRSLCLVIPLTTAVAEKPHRLHVMFGKRIGQVLLSQIRIIDEKRLLSKMGWLSPFQFSEIKKTLMKLLFP